MSRIARNSVNGRLNRNTFCSGAEVVPVQCKRRLRLLSEIGMALIVHADYVGYSYRSWGSCDLTFLVVRIDTSDLHY